ncbi:GNAT family N-acetyltransferase [Streptomyces chilikensis]|uniref:GNAT family N-acetyltransferase n=1 Tax=Streptomyces chilikensis TaxID=1194079 RepID=UPI00140AE748|nr:GNAT family N-acetyltransferase [Streptomyces chilikensis]
MADLRIQQPDGDVTLADWRFVHNAVVPAHRLSLAEARERAKRDHLEVAYLGDAPVGCTTVRPPAAGTATATVIARVLPAHRRRGLGGELYARGLRRARELGAGVIETVVLSSSGNGLRFACRNGFQEVERYLLDGETVPWVDLRLARTATGRREGPGRPRRGV